MLSFSQIRNEQKLNKTSSFTSIAQAAILAYYLKPYPKKMPEADGVDRLNHGGVHVSSTALNVEMIFELYKKYKPELLKHPITNKDLTEDDLKLLKLAAIYHDSANTSEGYGNEIKHANNFRKDMLSLGWTKEEIEPFAMAIQEKDRETNKNILEEIIHDADCLDIIRVVGGDFDKNYLDIIKHLNKCPGFITEFNDIVANHFETIAIFDSKSRYRRTGTLHQFCETQKNCYLAVYHAMVNMLKTHIISSCLAKGKNVSESELDIELSKINILELYNRKNSNILQKWLKNDLETPPSVISKMDLVFDPYTTEINSGKSSKIVMKYLEKDSKIGLEAPSLSSSSSASSNLTHTVIASVSDSTSLINKDPAEIKKTTNYTILPLNSIAHCKDLQNSPILTQYILRAAASGVSIAEIMSETAKVLFGLEAEDHIEEMEQIINNILIQEYPHYFNPNNGESSLFTAAKLGDKSKVELLLQTEGMDYFSLRHPGDGKSAYQIALEQGHEKIAELIQQKIYESSFESFSKAEIAEILLDDMARSIFETAGINIQEIEKNKNETKEEEKTPENTMLPSFTQHLKKLSKIPDLKGSTWFNYINELKDIKMSNSAHHPIQINTIDEWMKRDKKADNWTQTYIIKEKPDLNPSKIGDIFSTSDKKESKITDPTIQLETSPHLPIPTDSNRNSIWAQKLFSDVVSNTDTLNKDEKVYADVISAIRKSGQADPERIYEQLIDFLKNHTVIVLGFNAKFLKEEGLEYYRPLNRWEKEKKPGWQIAEDYTFDRLTSEKKLVKNIDTRLQKDFFANPEALHRYAALVPIDNSNGVKSAFFLYGKSYLVLNKVVAFNSVFVAEDSFEKKGQRNKNFRPATYHHFDVLLAELSKNGKLASLIERIITGTLPASYLLNSYMEAHVPRISLDCIDHIHLDEEEYKKDLLTQTEIELFSKAYPNITITHSSTNPHPETHDQFLSHIEKNERKEAENLLKKYPFLMKVTNALGEGPLHIAVKQGHYDLINFLIKKGAPVNELAQGKAPLHLALELKENRFQTVQALITSCFELYEGRIKKRRGLELDLNRQTYQPNSVSDRNTPLLTLLSSHEVDLQILDMLIKYGADIDPKALNLLSKLAKEKTTDVPETLAQVFHKLKQDETKRSDLIQQSIFSTLTSEINKDNEPTPDMKSLENAKLLVETEKEKLNSLNEEAKKLSQYAEINYSDHKLDILQQRYIQLEERVKKLKSEEIILEAKIKSFSNQLLLVNPEFISATEKLDESQELLKNASFFTASDVRRALNHHMDDLKKITIQKQFLENQLSISCAHLEENKKHQDKNKNDKDNIQTKILSIENHNLYKNILDQIREQQIKIREAEEEITLFGIKSIAQQFTRNER